VSADRLAGLLTILALIAVHALLTLAFGALVNTRAAWLREQEEEGNQRAAKILRLTTGTNQLNMTYQIAVTLLRFAIAGVAVHDFAEPLVLGNPTITPTLIVGVVLFVTAALTVILGDLVPESFGSGNANTLAFWFVDFMSIVVVLLSPVVAVVLAISKGLSSVMGSSSFVNTVTEEEIMTLIDAGHTGGTIEEEEKDMIYSVLQLNQTRASEVMVPRIDVIAVEINKTLDEAGLIFIRSGYSRVPVYEGTVDHVRGVLYAKDLLAYWHNGNNENGKTVNDLMRPAYFVPETKRADELLKELQTQKVHLAIVVDEYGGTAGLVTIENIIEEIIGDIQDEYDFDEEAEYEELTPDVYLVDASIDLDDFNDLLEVELPTDDSDTLGGYIYTYFGRVPLIGEIIEDEDLAIRVVSVDGRRIRKLHVVRKRLEDEDTASVDVAVTATNEVKILKDTDSTEQEVEKVTDKAV